MPSEPCALCGRPASAHSLDTGDICNFYLEPSRTFDEAFVDLKLTPDERSALVWHLAEIRTRKLTEALLPRSSQDEVLDGQ